MKDSNNFHLFPSLSRGTRHEARPHPCFPFIPASFGSSAGYLKIRGNNASAEWVRPANKHLLFFVSGLKVVHTQCRFQRELAAPVSLARIRLGQSITAWLQTVLIRFPERYVSGAGGVSRRMEFCAGKSKICYK